MRAELPWNVAGIPPEAREAARAAARREGLSVGEWLTRRILRSFSGMGEEAPPVPYEPRPDRRPPWTAGACRRPPPAAATPKRCWPASAAAKAESTEAWRRIEDQLRGLSPPAGFQRAQPLRNPTASCRAPPQEMNISRPRTGPGLRPAGPDT